MRSVSWMMLDGKLLKSQRRQDNGDCRTIFAERARSSNQEPHIWTLVTHTV